jgi:hypothetical protein
MLRQTVRLLEFLGFGLSTCKLTGSLGVVHFHRPAEVDGSRISGRQLVIREVVSE